jgi:hypothetical protein
MIYVQNWPGHTNSTLSISSGAYNGDVHRDVNLDVMLLLMGGGEGLQYNVDWDGDGGFCR